MDETLKLRVNGEAHSVTTDPRRPLLDVLREDLQLTGTKYGCGEGQCGARTVLVDGQRTFSCRAAIGDVGEKPITTIEGLAKGDKLHPVQAAYLAEGAFQCGYCTPGMILATVALLDAKPKPSDAEIVGWMNKNLCRCCGYAKIVSAVHKAAGAAREAAEVTR